jgi:acyl carrier protein
MTSTIAISIIILVLVLALESRFDVGLAMEAVKI